ncbi:L-rhamnose mutarotase [Tunicatimonas pelagia]|uniref:L-rhamnose mutarotase n=1 Tax=Tunicatimonas pelagia TaxID=931531 RepID=UPI00266513F1|nr:L-rhamnose mutarotase [Tunicatimonas pelagia]WKN43449.1 L-rhamnose mutarotase [Tunicatimonas pelagia]
MKDYAQTVNLKNDPEVIREYEKHHAAVWPEVLSALKEVGVIDMKIYRLGRRLFMFMQTEDDFDLNVDMPRYLALHPRCREWESLMGTFQEKVPEAQPHEKWAIMKKIFEF